MKPQLLKVSTNLAHSFSARKDIMPDINNRWHYHAEVELIYFKKGKGTQFIGDSIQSFNDGDVVIVGSNLPHYWRFDDTYFEKQNIESIDVSVVHFNENFWGSSFLNLPENQELKKILQQSKRGIQVLGDDREQIGLLISKIIETEGSKKIILLIDALLRIGNSKEVNYLSSIGFKYNFQESEKDRVYAIYNYTIANFKKKITLHEIAEVAKVSPNSFCKYFKSRNRKTYSQFINEIRVGHACKLLIENKMNVKEICFDSGFYNFASFHKYFKSITGKSPLHYQKTFNS